MAKNKKLSTTTRFTKLITDFANNFIKPLAIIADPIAGIVLYSLALYLSWQHAQAHFNRVSQKAKARGEPGPTSIAKVRILAGRLFFDVMGLGLSIALLGVHLLGGYILGTMGKAVIFGFAAFSMTASSVLSTAHKFRRSFKPDKKLTLAEAGRLFMGVAGTVFLPLVLYGVISAAFLTSPLALLGGTVLVGILGIAKGYNAYKAYKEQKILRNELKTINSNLALCITQSQKTLERLFEIGDSHAVKLLSKRLKDIIRAMLALKGPKPITKFQAFCASFEITRETIEVIAKRPLIPTLELFLNTAFPPINTEDRSAESSSILTRHTSSLYLPSFPAGQQASNSSPLANGASPPPPSEGVTAPLVNKLIGHSQHQADNQNSADNLDNTQSKNAIILT